MTYRHTGEEKFDMFQRETHERLGEIENRLAGPQTVQGVITMSLGTTETSQTVGSSVKAVALGGTDLPAAVYFRLHGGSILASASAAVTATFILLQ